MDKKALYSLLLAAAVTPTAFADEINQTISVTKETEVVEHKATKLSSLPEAAPVTTSNVSLNYSDWAVPTQVDPLLVVQRPQRQFDGFTFGHKRGYADLAMGNYFNVAADAGYRIIHREKTQLGLWFQHNSTNGSISNPLVFDSEYSVGGGLPRKKIAIEDRIGIDVAQHFNAGTLSAVAAAHLARFNYYGMLDYDSDFTDKETVEHRQKANEATIDLGWNSPANPGRSFGYYAGIKYNYFGFADPTTWRFGDTAKGLKENNLTARLGAEFVWDENSHIGIDLAFDYLGYKNNIYEYDVSDNGSIIGSYIDDSKYIATIAPYYRLTKDRMILNLGARLDLANSGTTLRVAPNVRFDYQFSRHASLELSATGGNRANAIHTVAERNRYVDPSQALWANTYTLVDAEARLNIGLFKGFSLTPYVGFAVVKNAYLPLLLSEYDPALSAGSVRYADVNLNGIKLGFDMTYKFRSILDLQLGYMFTPQSEDSGYINGDDRAEHNVNAKLTVHPIKALDIWAAYNFRSGRNALVYDINYDEIFDAIIPTTTTTGLGIVSDLSFGAVYRINDMIHVSAQGNNLLNRRWQHYLGMRNQGIHFLVGVGVKF